ncbi:tyrosine-type recombinase/integrase, partial [Desulfovibrio sp.]|uniref:tyrosine-type recombinase/integrase n=1 Tax=Desulfovibrio sp. TaxID=885 RepID=UPI00307FAF2D
SICRMLKRLCREAGVREFGFHALRHYFASMLVSTNKVTLCDIQHMLGHQRATTTTDTYLHSLCPPVDHLAGVIEEMNQPLKAS